MSKVFSLQFLSLASCLMTSLSLFAEEWGFAYSGQLLEKVDGERTVVKVGGSTSYVTNFYVRLYDDALSSSTNVLWSKLIENVPVQDGNFAFEVSGRGDNGVDLPDAFANHSDGVMTIGVTPFDSDHREITPRQALDAVPYAAFACDALGTRGDATFGGKLEAASVKARTAKFTANVSHAGEVTFVQPLVLPTLALDESTGFEITDALVVSNTLKAEKFDVPNVTAVEAQLTLESAETLAAESLAVSGPVRSTAVTAADGKSVTLAGDVTASTISAAQIELTGKVNLFDFKGEITHLPYSKSGGTGAYWGMEDGICFWTAHARDFTDPTEPKNTHNYFVSLSLLVTPGEKPGENQVTVKVGSQENKLIGTNIATFGITGVSGPVWMPVQTFLKPGESIVWSGGGSWTSNNVHLVYRQVGF